VGSQLGGGLSKPCGSKYTDQRLCSCRYLATPRSNPRAYSRDVSIKSATWSNGFDMATGENNSRQAGNGADPSTRSRWCL
jgi:hypothetical protein